MSTVQSLAIIAAIFIAPHFPPKMGIGAGVVFLVLGHLHKAGYL